MVQPVAPASQWLPADTVSSWASACLEAQGLTPSDAQLLASSLVQTSLWGIDSHGIGKLPHYLERFSRGSIKTRPQVRVQASGPSTAQVFGDQGHGILVAHQAMAVAQELARTSGVGVVGVTDSSHCGAMALFARPVAQAGMIAFAFTHSDSMAAPFGGTRAFFGTNPICIAIPRLNAEPVCLDMATTSIPFNRVINARREGIPLPEGVAYDAAGHTTTDARQAQSLIPLGSTEFGYKGYGLALMIDLLCGPLNGNPYGPTISNMFTEMDQPRHLGAFFMVLDPKRFAGGGALPQVVQTMATALASEPGSPLMPGDPELLEEQRRRRCGIPVEPVLATQFHDWSLRLGVPLL